MQTKESTEISGETPKLERKVDEGSEQAKRVKVASSAEWEAVFDLKSSRYYYWNKVECGQSGFWEGYQSDDLGLSGRCYGAEGAVVREGVCPLPRLWGVGRRLGGVVRVLWFL